MIRTPLPLKSALSRFVSEHFAIVVGGGLVAFLVAVAYLGPSPPPEPAPANCRPCAELLEENRALRAALRLLVSKGEKP
jgi:hypothetical protein